MLCRRVFKNSHTDASSLFFFASSESRLAKIVLELDSLSAEDLKHPLVYPLMNDCLGHLPENQHILRSIPGWNVFLQTIKDAVKEKTGKTIGDVLQDTGDVKLDSNHIFCTLINTPEHQEIISLLRWWAAAFKDALAGRKIRMTMGVGE